MVDGLEETIESIKGDAEKAAVWFQPEGEKHFLPPDLIKNLAEILVLTFLAGFQQEATKTAKNAGKSAFKWMRDSIVDLFAAKKAVPSRENAAKRVAAAKRKAKSLSSDHFEMAVTKTRHALQQELEATMPSDQALALAQKIAEQAVQQVLRRPASKKKSTKKGRR